MDFISNREPQINEMLQAIGIESVDALFQGIPESLQLARPDIDDGLSEYEGLSLMEGLAKRNTFPDYDNYLGGGAYEHHIPAIVGAICSKSEFLTAYTPYQAEASQGMLQAIFEFQTVLCRLTGMDVANASVYDGASACAEAVLMALRHKKGRSKVVISEGLNPHYRAVVDQYLEAHNLKVITLKQEESGEGVIDSNTAAILIQSPNYFGTIEGVKKIANRAKEQGALTLLCANPLAYGLFSSAEELGADIAVGDVQPFGVPMQFGGPYAGYMACRKALMRQLPGRIVGETVDREGKRGFVLTLQAREQHIRREKATSNICTNQALVALASLIGILWYGKEGVKELALTNYQRAEYLKEKLRKLAKVASGVTFNEFTLSFNHPLDVVLNHFYAEKIVPGIPVGNALLVAVTETKSQEQLDRYCAVLEKMGALR